MAHALPLWPLVAGLFGAGLYNALLVLGAIIIAAATTTVLRHRDLSHLAPLGVFVALIALAATLS